jgi:hypothetical protein
VVDGSHNLFAELDVRQGHEEDHAAARAAACATGIIPALRAGDLLLWDARALHCSYPGAAATAAHGQAAQPELLRATVHMCLSPRALATEEVLEQRRWAYRENLTLNHQGHHMNERSAARLVRLEGFEHPPPAPLTPVQLSLLG